MIIGYTESQNNKVHGLNNHKRQRYNNNYRGYDYDDKNMSNNYGGCNNNVREGVHERAQNQKV